MMDSRNTRQAFYDSLNHKMAALRVPLSGTIELTRRCNLRCAHCYARDAADQEELPEAFWLSLVDTLATEGCLYLLLTGGEPLLRPDFPKIYTRAAKQGIVTTVFTNGTVITPEALDAFSVYPPHVVEVSLYGAGPETSARVTGAPGSFSACLEGVRALRSRGVRVSLKTVQMTLNSGGIHQMRDIARDLGVDFRVDAAIMPGLSGGKEPLAFRVSPAEAVAEELSDPRRLKLWRDYYAKTSGRPVFEALYNCGAGLTEFHVDPGGVLRPCLLVREPSYPLAGGRFQEGWALMKRVREQPVAPDFPCARCDKAACCDACPGFFGLETGSAETVSDYICQMAHLRHAAILGGESEVSHDG
jgi:MoaA/NifB/PqqE/SkfB family radical SAM enzyme